MDLKATDIVNLLGLEELPEEGGFFARTYRSTEYIQLERGIRPVGDAIYYLITEDHFSGLHKLKCDEIWHFYAGDSVEMLLFDEKDVRIVTLGNSNFSIHLPQQLVRSGVWQGAKLKPGGKWALLGTNAFPGYDQTDFTLGKFEMFKELSKEHFEMIKKYVK